jgi:hypothetical protein
MSTRKLLVLLQCRRPIEASKYLAGQVEPVDRSDGLRKVITPKAYLRSSVRLIHKGRSSVTRTCDPSS